MQFGFIVSSTVGMNRARSSEKDECSRVVVCFPTTLFTFGGVSGVDGGGAWLSSLNPNTAEATLQLAFRHKKDIA